jgi:phospholipase C
MRAFQLVLISLSLVLIGSAALTPAAAWKTDNHPSIVEAALLVLERDNFTYLPRYLVDNGYLKKIKEGVTDCDRLDLALNHYYDPATGGGLAGAMSAAENAQDFFDAAVEEFKDGSISSAWYYFGWSLHCVQDLFVPFHAALDPGNGHAQYEAFAGDYRRYFPGPLSGTYDAGENASEWVSYAAGRSFPYYSNISGANATEANFDAALMVLYPEAIAATAGYIKFFADRAGLGEFNLWTISKQIDSVKVGWDECVGGTFYQYEVYVSTVEDEVLDRDPYAIIGDRTQTWQEITGLHLGTAYFVKVKAVTGNGTDISSLLQTSPAYPWFLWVPFGAMVVVVLILFMFKAGKRRGKVET